MNARRAVRSILRRAVRPLPVAAQIAIRRARGVLAGRQDAAAIVGARRAREQHWLDETTTREGARPDRQRILIAAPQLVPPWLETSYSLATALRLRGHDVRGVLCDGVLPLCEMNLGAQERPSCAMCVGWLARHEDAYGFAFARLSDFVSPADRADAEAFVDECARRTDDAVLADGIDLARLARRELQRYRRGFVFEPLADPAYRQWLVSAALLVRLFARLLDREQPAILIAPSGRTLTAACASEVARSRGIRVVTWDTEPSFDDALVFSHDRAAVEIPLDEAWTQAQAEPLTAEQTQRLRTFLDRWAASEATPFPYNPSPIEHPETIRSQLGLRADRRLVAVFANSAWDMAVVDRDVGFANMFECLFALVDFAIAHREVDLVVRAHPAEVKVPPDLVSRTPVVREIRKRYASLPDNIKLVDGHSAISSYVLAEMAEVAIVYASRLGLELAIRGRRPWVAGDVTYRGKGFTRDLASKADMIAALETGSVGSELSGEERKRAERFAYLWFFRYVTRLPRLRPAGGSIAPEAFRALAPGGDPTIDAVCDALVHGSPFVDLARLRTCPRLEVRNTAG